MGRLEDGARMVMAVLVKQGHSQRAVARLIGVTEGTVRYHRQRGASARFAGNL